MREILLQQIPNLWRADALTAAAPQFVSSGYAQLDAALGGGWPVPGLLELLCDQWGMGELQLLLPLMKTLSESPMPTLMSASSAATPRPVLWINPPFEPQAIALAQHGMQPAQHWSSRNLNAADAVWAVEQSLRSGACALVLSWLSGLNMPSLRRLKLAALSGACVGVLFRPPREATQTTAANLRLKLTATHAGLHVELFKVQGRRPTSVWLTMKSEQPCSLDKTVL
jgi:hypothetical protein